METSKGILIDKEKVIIVYPQA